MNTTITFTQWSEQIHEDIPTISTWKKRHGKDHVLPFPQQVSKCGLEKFYVKEELDNWIKDGWIKGVFVSNETRLKISNKLKGKTKSEETKKRMSAAQSGSNNPSYGKSRSEETRSRISESMKLKT